MAHNLDTAALRAFVVVAETGGMTRAAGLLNLTQGAVSQQVRRLEDVFGEALFERGRRGLRLTAAGERMLPRAQRLLELNDAIWTMMTAPHVEGEVRLGVPEDVVGCYMPPILKSFSREWPRLRVRMVNETTPTLLTLLEAGDLDLTMTTEQHPAPRAEILATEPLVWIGAPGGIAHTRTPVPLALGAETCAFRAPILEALGRAGLDWTVVCSLSNMESNTAMVAADLAVQAVLRVNVPPPLRMLPQDSGLPELPLFHVALHGAGAPRSKGADMLAEHIRQAFTARAAA